MNINHRLPTHKKSFTWFKYSWVQFLPWNWYGFCLQHKKEPGIHARKHDNYRNLDASLHKRPRKAKTKFSAINLHRKRHKNIMGQSSILY